MVSPSFVRAAALATAVGLVAAQTSSDCDPTKGKDCPPDPAFGGSASYEFSSATSVKDLKSFWKVDGGVEFAEPKTVSFAGANGANFVISKDGQSATLMSNKYLFFGKVEVGVKAAPGAGIVTAITLLSDSLDELDFEWVGNHGTTVETNYYSKNQNDHHNFRNVTLGFRPQDAIHTYSLEWTPTYITWAIDGNPVRTATPADSPGTWPQTPAQLKLGLWCGGCSAFDSAPDTQAWAGGRVDWAQAPFAGAFTSVKVQDYGGGVVGASEYVWADRSGLWTGIKPVGGTKRDMPGAPGGAVQAPPAPATTAAAPASAASSAKVGAASSAATSVVVARSSTSAAAVSSSSVKTTGSAPAPSKTTSPAAPSQTTNAAAKNVVSGAGFALLALAYLV